MTLHLNGLLLYERGAPVDFDRRRRLQIDRRAIATRASCSFSKKAKPRARFWTTDLTAEYVRLNADYHT